MERRFDAFVVFAEMRTGSNHLEESLNSLEDVTCHGEVFNPTFIGHHNRFEFLGYDLHRRDRDPVGLIDAMIKTGGALPGFRYFHDHDARVLDRVLDDTRIAKVLLTRSPLDAYVSRKIAGATGQWRLTDLKHAKSGQIVFDAREFETMLSAWTAFRDMLRHRVQSTGQTVFHIRYDDINDVDVLNGLGKFLGSDHTLPSASRRLKRQNPGAIQDKVKNVGEMETALSRIDRFGLDRVTDGEVQRQAGVPGFVAHPHVPLLFFPVAGAPVDPVLAWLGGIGGVGPDALRTGMTQRDLRKWMQTNPGYVSLAIVRHPARRLLAAYEVLQRAEDAKSAETREVLETRYDVPMMADGGVTPDALTKFASFLKGCLRGQTSLKIIPAWATQTSILQGAVPVALPHRVIREGDATRELSLLAEAMGIDAPVYKGCDAANQSPTATLSHKGLQKAVFDTYRKDFVQLGFAPSVIAAADPV